MDKLKSIIKIKTIIKGFIETEELLWQQKKFS